MLYKKIERASTSNIGIQIQIRIFQLSLPNIITVIQPEIINAFNTKLRKSSCFKIFMEYHCDLQQNCYWAEGFQKSLLESLKKASKNHCWSNWRPWADGNFADKTITETMIQEVDLTSDLIQEFLVEQNNLDANKVSDGQKPKWQKASWPSGCSCLRKCSCTY